MTYFMAHRTEIALALAWLFSTAMNSMPPLPANAGWFVRWVHDVGQAIGANFSKVKQPPV